MFLCNGLMITQEILLYATIAYRKKILMRLKRKDPEILIETERRRVINSCYATKRLVQFVQQLNRTNSALNIQKQHYNIIPNTCLLYIKEK